MPIEKGELRTASLPRTARQGTWYVRLLETLEKRNARPEVRNDPATVSLALQLMAAPMPSYQRFEAGAGLVSQDQLTTFISAFVPSRFIQLFCDPADISRLKVQDIEALDQELGPLWDTAQSTALREHVSRGGVICVARVL